MQPGQAPFGAKCAVHPERDAGLVCGRCGNFMCGACAGGGALCPSCQRTVGTGFPFQRNDFDFNRLWAHAYAAWQRDWLMLTVGAVIFVAIVTGGSLVTNVLNRLILAALNIEIDQRNPLGSVKALVATLLVGQTAGALVNMIVQGIGLLGLIRLTMDVLLGKKADVGRMFVTLRKLPTYIVTQLILFVLLTVPSLLFMGGVFVAALASAGFSVRHLDDVRLQALASATPIALFVAGVAVLVVAALALLSVTMFPAMELVVSECGPFEAIVRAWRIVSGLRLRLVGYALASWGLMVASVMLCCVPVIVVAPLAYALLVAFFLAARNGLDLPPPDHA